MKWIRLIPLALLIACVPIIDDDSDYEIVGSWHIHYFDSVGNVHSNASYQSKVFVTHQVLQFYDDNTGAWETTVTSDSINYLPTFSSYPFTWSYADSSLYMVDDLNCWLSEVHGRVDISDDVIFIRSRPYMILKKQ